MTATSAARPRRVSRSPCSKAVEVRTEERHKLRRLKGCYVARRGEAESNAIADDARGVAHCVHIVIDCQIQKRVRIVM